MILVVFSNFSDFMLLLTCAYFVIQCGSQVTFSVTVSTLPSFSFTLILCKLDSEFLVPVDVSSIHHNTLVRPANLSRLNKWLCFLFSNHCFTILHLYTASIHVMFSAI